MEVLSDPRFPKMFFCYKCWMEVKSGIIETEHEADILFLYRMAMVKGLDAVHIYLTQDAQERREGRERKMGKISGAHLEAGKKKGPPGKGSPEKKSIAKKHAWYWRQRRGFERL